MPELPGDEEERMIEQALRLGELRYQVMDKVDGPFLEGGVDNLPMDQQIQFWEHVLAVESAEEETMLERLRQEAGYVPPGPDELAGPETVKRVLWELIEALASIRVFLHFTDHLSDVELYSLLVMEELREPVSVPLPGSAWNYHIDVSLIVTPEDPDGTLTWLRYYADDQMRADWEGEVPDKLDLPYDRDRFLPVPPEERGGAMGAGGFNQ